MIALPPLVIEWQAEMHAVGGRSDAWATASGERMRPINTKREYDVKQCRFINVPSCAPVTPARLRGESPRRVMRVRRECCSSQRNLRNRLDSSGKFSAHGAEPSEYMRSLVAPSERRPPAGSRFSSKPASGPLSRHSGKPRRLPTPLCGYKEPALYVYLRRVNFWTKTAFRGCQPIQINAAG